MMVVGFLAVFGWGGKKDSYVTSATNFNLKVKRPSHVSDLKRFVFGHDDRDRASGSPLLRNFGSQRKRSWRSGVPNWQLVGVVIFESVVLKDVKFYIIRVYGL
jgi:hypothetical protein